MQYLLIYTESDSVLRTDSIKRFTQLKLKLNQNQNYLSMFFIPLQRNLTSVESPRTELHLTVLLVDVISYVADVTVL